MEAKEYFELKKEVEKLQSDKNRAEGELNGLKKRLMDEFGCETLDEAKVLLTKLEGKETDAEKKFNKALKKFKTRWSKRLS